MRPLAQSLSVRLFAGALFAAASFGSLPAFAQQTMTVTDARGEVEIPAEPKTVVVFDVATLDTLDAFGVSVAGVPKFPAPDYLSSFADVEQVGSLFEPDMEAVNALEPDLIIVGGRSARQAEALAAIAPTIDMSVDQTKFLESAESNVRLLGKIFHKEDEAEKRLTALEESVAALRDKAANTGRTLIVLTTGNKMSAYGKGSRFGVLYDGFGFKPADENLTVANHGEAISFEYIAETNPDWLFVIDRDAAIGQGSAAAVLDNELVAGTTAWKEKQVVYLTPANWYLIGGGVQAMQQNVDQISAALDKAAD